MNEPNWTAAFLKRVRVTDNPAGDFIADLRSDLRRGVTVPRLFHSKEEMRSYVRSQGGCREAIAAVDDVWPRYRRFVDQHPFGAEIDSINARGEKFVK